MKFEQRMDVFIGGIVDILDVVENYFKQKIDLEVLFFLDFNRDCIKINILNSRDIDRMEIVVNNMLEIKSLFVVDKIQKILEVCIELIKICIW